MKAARFIQDKRLSTKGHPMFYYTFLLTPTRNKSTINFSEYRDILVEAANKINNGLAFRRDAKSLNILPKDIADKEIILTLASQMPLTNPARSLSALTRYLTTYYPDQFHPYVYNKTLFNIKLLNKESSMEGNIDNINNEDLLKGMIDLLYGHIEPNPKMQEQVTNQIKEILKPYLK